MGREIRRTKDALASTGARGGRRENGGASPAASGRSGHEAISRTRAIVQVVLTAVLLPLALYVVFGPASFTPPARDAASALLGAIVTFWLKD